MTKSIQYKLVNVNKIHIDPDLNINISSESDQLRSSIKQFGFLNPLTCFQNNEQIYVVDGHLRLRIASELSVKSVPVSFLDSTPGFSDIAKIRLISLKYDSEPNLYQKISLYHYLTKNNVPDPELELWKRQFNLPNQESQLNNIIRVLQWPESILGYINKYNASYKQLRPLLNKSITELGPIFDIGLSLSVRLVELISISELIFESALNQNTTIEKILAHESVHVILSNEHFTKSQKIQHLKNTLFKLRYPTISRYREQAKQKLRELNLPTGVQIKFDKSFESEGFHIIINIKNTNIYKETLDLLNTKNNHKAIKEILDLL